MRIRYTLVPFCCSRSEQAENWISVNPRNVGLTWKEIKDVIIQAKINGSESDSDEDKIDFDLSLQSVLKDFIQSMRAWK